MFKLIIIYKVNETPLSLTNITLQQERPELCMITVTQCASNTITREIKSLFIDTTLQQERPELSTITVTQDAGNTR